MNTHIQRYLVCVFSHVQSFIKPILFIPYVHTVMAVWVSIWCRQDSLRRIRESWETYFYTQRRMNRIFLGVKIFCVPDIQCTCTFRLQYSIIITYCADIWRHKSTRAREYKRWLTVHRLLLVTRFVDCHGKHGSPSSPRAICSHHPERWRVSYHALPPQITTETL